MQCVWIQLDTSSCFVKWPPKWPLMWKSLSHFIKKTSKWLTLCALHLNKEWAFYRSWQIEFASRALLQARRAAPFFLTALTFQVFTMYKQNWRFGRLFSLPNHITSLYCEHMPYLKSIMARKDPNSCSTVVWQAPDQCVAGVCSVGLTTRAKSCFACVHSFQPFILCNIHSHSKIGILGI